MVSKRHLYIISITSVVFFVASFAFLLRYSFKLDKGHGGKPQQQRPSHMLAQTVNQLNSFDLQKLEQLFEYGDKEYHNGNVEKAIVFYRNGLALYPSIIGALLRLGRAFAKGDRHDLAINEYKTALTINPSHVITYLLLGRSLIAEKRFDEATVILEHALKLDPTSAKLHMELAKLHSDRQNYETALKHIDKAQEIAPNSPYAYLIRGHILNWKGDIGGAIDMYKKAALIDPKCANAHYNLGHTLKVYGKFHEAIDSLKKAAALDPRHVDTHVALSHAYWALGDFENAWKEYNWRWKQYKRDPRNKTISKWHGQDLHGKTILLYSEQGFGDTLQFIRFAQELKQRGAIVWCKVQKILTTLLSLCPYIDHIVTEPLNTIAVDFQVALMDMPGKLQLTPQTIPASKQYLFADKQLVASWKEKLATDKKLKIGLCWYVDQEHEIYKLPIARRSVPITSFIPLAQMGTMSFYCLQRTNNKLRNEIPPELNLHIFPEGFDETHGRFMDSAAVIANLDLIITVDTSIAHLAAGLGKEVWMLLPYSSDCRWYLQTDRSPWYPTMRIFRQPKPGNWQPVIAKIYDKLTYLCKTK